MELLNLLLFSAIEVMHQWRLAVLFVISGLGTAFVFRRRTWSQYVKERGTRLGIPRLFGTYIVSMGIFDQGGTTAGLFRAEVDCERWRRGGQAVDEK